MSRVPLCNVVIDSWEETAFEDAKENSGGHKAGVILHKTLAYHGDGPEDHDECEPDAGSYSFHHDVAGDFGCNVKGEQDSEAVIILKTVEFKIFF